MRVFAFSNKSFLRNIEINLISFLEKPGYRAKNPQSGQFLPTFNKGLSKTEITSRLAKSIEKVIDEGNVLEIAELLMVMDEFITRFRKDSVFIGSVRDELDKYKGNFQSAGGTKN